MRHGLNATAVSLSSRFDQHVHHDVPSVPGAVPGTDLRKRIFQSAFPVSACALARIQIAETSRIEYWKLLAYPAPSSSSSVLQFPVASVTITRVRRPTLPDTGASVNAAHILPTICRVDDDVDAGNAAKG